MISKLVKYNYGIKLNQGRSSDKAILNCKSSDRVIIGPCSATTAKSTTVGDNPDIVLISSPKH